MTSSLGKEKFKTQPEMKRNFRNALRPQLRSFESPLCQAVCKMLSARVPHTENACEIGREKQKLPTTSQEISVISRNRMLSLSPWPVVCYLFCHDQYRLILVSRYWLEGCKEYFTGVTLFLKISAVLLTRDDGQTVWLGGRHSLPPWKSAFQKACLSPKQLMWAECQVRRGGRATLWEEWCPFLQPLKNICPLYGLNFSVRWSCQRWFNSCWVLFDSSQSPRMKLRSGAGWLLAASPATALGTAPYICVMQINKCHHRADHLSPFAGTAHLQCWGLRWGAVTALKGN